MREERQPLPWSIVANNPGSSLESRAARVVSASKHVPSLAHGVNLFSAKGGGGEARQSHEVSRVSVRKSDLPVHSPLLCDS